MKVLLVHNHYGSMAPSGENRVFEMERELLERNGCEVLAFERHSDRLRAYGTLGKVAGALMTPWNPLSAYQMHGIVRSFAPDVVHAHNTFPTISPSIFAAAGAAARVLTLHNYRLVCPAAIPMRQGRVCTECIDTLSVLPALRHRCYRGSRAATLPLAANVAFNRWRGTWQNEVDRFVALTDFQREVMIRAGLPSGKISVKPNSYPGNPEILPFHTRPKRVVCVGRVGVEKGVGELVDAWLAWGNAAPELRIIGDGPQRPDLERRAGLAKNIKFLGSVSSTKAEYEIGRARLLLLPSRWFEGFPMVLREAFALGTPVGVSDLGPLPGLVREVDGILFRPGDSMDLLTQVRGRWAEMDRLASMSEASAVTFKKKYSEQQNMETLTQIYHDAMNTARTERTK